MVLPKAILCLLGDVPAHNTSEEACLRAAGFATASIPWNAVSKQPRGWMQLLPLLDDPSVGAWVLAGPPASFIPELRAQVACLLLALQRSRPPVIAYVLHGDGEVPSLSPLMGNIQVFSAGVPFAGKLMAAQFKPREAPSRPCHVTAHLDPYIGQWLEIGPAAGEIWDGFMIGVLAADVEVFGVGPRGVIPDRSTLQHPLCGIRGEFDGAPFSACAAKNRLMDDHACFMRVEGAPRHVFVGVYPDAGVQDVRVSFGFEG